MSDLTTSTTLFVPGHPAAQGSKAFKGMRNGKPILVEQSGRVAPWRQSVATAARFVHPDLVTGPVSVRLEFVMPRPKSAKRDVVVPATKRTGDLDKLSRAVFDALSGSAFVDDAQVTELHATKRVALTDEAPGVRITLTTREQQ
ncbi:RusA family crossover junction endodeoxyribonuclease [Williamsia phyllosphaerae]|uniref:Uncharacterized protein n=1 Tax=Williamsia phyllosphaerae TaxID=885042 RepID=A0ABQ1V728_9NOCA|nr:RusA family crossover junction endodeoxyribonuclease [Williamsia phyllosphaerae]GGF38965.1 hypothetical protein GCM10007298_38320 [Williamsia phyllosphaerae]